jgi:hypothetical protein
VILAAALLASFAFSGCAWLGKGKDVADAYTNTRNAKSGSYSVDFSVDAPGNSRAEEISESFLITGAFDSNDPAHPMARAATTIDGKKYSFVEPGNGKEYVTYEGETTSYKLPKQTRSEDTTTTNKLLDALAAAIVNFRDAPALTNGAGVSVPAIAADVSRSKLCGYSLRASARAINSSKILGEDFPIHIRKSEVRSLGHACSHALASPPQLTFGIDNGSLTEFLLLVKLRDSGRIVTIDSGIHLLGLNQPQTGFVPPKIRPHKGSGKARAKAASIAADGRRIGISIPSF